MKRIISVLLIAALAVSMFCVSFSSNAAGEVNVIFHSNHSSVADVFKSESISSGDTVDSDYDIPDVGERFIFKGWYYGKEDNARAVNFASDTFSEDTDIYAHWADAGVVKPDDSDVYNTNRGTYDDFDLAGVQVKTGEFTDTENGGLRFIASLSNSLLSELDKLSDSTVGIYNSRVEYGFIAARKAAVESWKAYGTSRNYDLSEYKIGYNDTNVNGVDTTAHDENYQGIVKNIDCTASDYSQSNITDHKKFDDYRLYTVAVTYPKAKSDSEEYTDEELEAFKNADVAVRAYLRYYDANGLLRTTYDDYNGIDSYGGLCTSYLLTENQSVNIGYYSSLSTMLTDVNNLTTENAVSSAENAVCSMYISGGKAYVTLLKNMTLGSTLRFTESVDLNLNNCTVNVGANRITSISDLDMYNGSYVAGANASSLSTHSGTMTRITNVSYSAENVNPASDFMGVYCVSNYFYITDCNFNIGETAKVANLKSYAVTLDNVKRACISGCDYSITSDVYFSLGVYSRTSSVEVSDCEFTMNVTADENTSASAASVLAANSPDTLVKDSKMTIGGDCCEAFGVYCFRSDNAGMNSFLEADNLEINVSVGNFYPVSDTSAAVAGGISVGKDHKASINNVKTDIKVASAADVPAWGIRATDNADIAVSDVDIDVTSTTGEDSYRLYGIITYEKSNLLVKSADIRVTPVLDLRGGGAGVEQNVGIGAYGNSTVTIDPEKDEDVFIQGGNAALANGTDAYFKVTGGNFCSPTHGGAYLGGNADITGGNYYSYYMAGHTEEGGFYVTHYANVNISNAYIHSNNRALRLKAQPNKPASPVVNVTDTYIKAPKGLDVTAGVAYLYSGTVIDAGTQWSGNVVDNRNN